MLDSLILLNSLSDAQKILRIARVKCDSGISDPVWNKLYNASEHLHKQTAALLADETEVTPDGA